MIDHLSKKYNNSTLPASMTHAGCHSMVVYIRGARAGWQAAKWCMVDREEKLKVQGY